MKKKFPILEVLVDAVLILFGTVASVCVIPSAYGVELNPHILVEICILLALYLSASLHLRKAALAPTLIYAAGVVIYGVLKRAQVAAGFRIVAYALMKPISVDFSFLPVPVEPDPALVTDANLQAFLFVAAAVFAFLIALALIKGRTAVPGLIIPAPAFLLSLIYTDCTPALYTVILLTIYAGGVLLARGVKKNCPEKAGRAQLVFLALIVALTAVLQSLAPARGFTPIPFAERQKMVGESIGRMQDTVLGFFFHDPREYDLSTEDDRFTNGSKAFSIYSTCEGTFLLRTHSYGRYSRSVWLAAPEYTGEWNSLEALGSTQTGRYEGLYIRDSYADERIVPYAFIRDEQVKTSESRVRSYGRTAYRWTFMPELQFEPKRIPREESAYYQFAIQNYTLPNGPEKDALIKLLSDEGLLPWFTAIQQIDHYQAAQLVAGYVRNQGTYTLTPGRVPSGKDFIQYFLRESHSGYCVHFASSTTAILQALGIPARYVIGYRAEISEAETWIDVPKKAAHAWTEVYIKGVGWLPIESSAGFAAYVNYTPSGTTVPGIIPQPTPTPEVSQTPRPIRTPLPFDSDWPINDPEESPTPRPLQTPRPGRGGSGENGSARGLWWLLAIPAAAALWEALGLYIKRRRDKRFAQEDSHAAVIAMLNYLRRFERYGEPLEPNDKALAEEAAFSNHPMEEAQKALQKRVRKVRAEFCRHKPLKRLFCRHVLLIR